MHIVRGRQVHAEQEGKPTHVVWRHVRDRGVKIPFARA